ncbi:MAG TPA: hypothetical protein VEQ42_06765 [Pyrinomonadaceae bacterium]|nr:hypothetical protein [Pyrinomonadaceae bacterium]
MRRLLRSLPAALVFAALALTLFQPGASRTVRAADIHEKCLDCSVRNNRQFEHCLEIHGINHIPCYDRFNEGVVICFRNFCEQ